MKTWGEGDVAKASHATDGEGSLVSRYEARKRVGLGACSMVCFTHAWTAGCLLTGRSFVGSWPIGCAIRFANVPPGHWQDGMPDVHLA